ncbi:hypothetical protein MLD38_032873 [Melastoma candidum]|nr:hypothetical protein MLD38_032873 [Melastoma candidum]
MGKKTQSPSPNQLIGAGGIRWVLPNSGPGDTLSSVSVKRRKAPIHSKAYTVSDILRTSVYQIVSAFYEEMLAGAKSGTLDRDWIGTSKPPFGTRDLLCEKLRLFLDFRVT